MPPPSQWGDRLESKLAALAATSSKETFQALAKWIAFNRKHAKDDFAPVLVENLKQESKQEMVLGVIHEVLVLNREISSKWNRFEDLRITLGEHVLLVVGDQLSESARTNIMDNMWKEWDDANSFGGPTVLNLIRKKLAKPASPAAETEATDPPVATKQETPLKSTPAAPKDPPSTDDSTKMSTPVASKPSRKPSDTPQSKDATPYNFEDKGIPAAKVDPKRFQEPCRAIATLQIARDLRNDGAVQLSSLLSSMPQDVRAACATAAENDNRYQLDAAKARDFSLRINSSLLDMDLDEQLQNVQTFRNIIDRQRQAREQLIHLLIQSRCKFGAEEAAEAFHTADRAKGEIESRKRILSDAMELEGLDVITDDKPGSETEEGNADLPPLSWYKSDASTNGGAPDAKRAKVN